MLPSILTNTVPFSTSDDPRCSVHIGLAQAVAQAVKDVDMARGEQHRARIEGQDVERYTVALADVRKEARLLVAALNNHRKEHGC